MVGGVCVIADRAVAQTSTQRRVGIRELLPRVAVIGVTQAQDQVAGFRGGIHAPYCTADHAKAGLAQCVVGQGRNIVVQRQHRSLVAAARVFVFFGVERFGLGCFCGCRSPVSGLGLGCSSAGFGLLSGESGVRDLTTEWSGQKRRAKSRVCLISWSWFTSDREVVQTPYRSQGAKKLVRPRSRTSPEEGMRILISAVGAKPADKRRVEREREGRSLNRVVGHNVADTGLVKDADIRAAV